ncbi:hypothetical protein GCM10022240_00300 [Microbacterium kribbense]|uniref:Glycosyltransferase 2-like domain-containing protein n=1 Tax=Microbacterium kribbense TaxID=433645 RepID=A0ABP7FZK3_9MICO
MILRVSVVVATYGRPNHIRTCLTRLSELITAPFEVVVVDGSPDTLTRDVVAEFPDVAYLRNDLGRGTTPESRQIGFAATTGEVIAFVDDDAFVEPEWLDELVAGYYDSAIVGVGGRALNGIEGEDTRGLDEIGRLLPDGRLTGNFAADPGRIVDVDHLLGANMSFLRSAIDAIGGIRGNYPGTCLCEESDISLRLARAGGRLVFAPRAIVHHVAAPYGIGGRRFDRRWLYYSRRNHIVMLARVFGWTDVRIPRYVGATLRGQSTYLRLAGQRLLARDPDQPDGSLRSRARFIGALTRSGAELVGLAAGFPAAFFARGQDRRGSGVR